MKKLLLVLLAGLSAAATQAQTHPGIPKPGVSFQPGQPTEAAGTEVAARPTGTIRVPGRTTNYVWDPATSQWSTPQVLASTYNSAGALTLELTTDSATSRPMARRTSTYSPANSILSSLNERWDGSTWQNERRAQFTYNARQNRITELLEQQWAAGAWQNQSRSVATYDSRDNVTSYLSQTWTNNAWVTQFGEQTAYIYNATGQILEKRRSKLNISAGTYETPDKELYTYLTSTSGLATEVIFQLPQNGTYLNIYRVLIGYDAQERLSRYDSQGWTAGAWVPTVRGTYTYATNTPSFVEVQEEYVRGTWVNTYRGISGLDAYNNTTEVLREDWTNNAWVLANGFRNLLRYDADNNVTRRVQQQFNGTSRTFVYSTRSTYGDYQTIVLGTKPNAALAARTALYPNPTTGAVTLAVADLPGTVPLKAELLNSLEQVVQTHSLQPRQGQLHHELHLEQLPAGPYLLRVQTPAGTIVKRVVRQ